MPIRRPLPSARRAARALALSALVTGLVAAAAAPAGAQDTPAGVRPYRFTVEGLLAQYAADDDLAAGENSLGGYGVRVLFNRSTPAATLRSFAERASVGAFLVYTAGKGEFDVATTHFGVQGDVSLMPRPAFRGTLDPFASLSLGGFRRSVEGGGSSTDLAVTPGLGTRLSLIQGFGLRGDLRVPIVFGDRTAVAAVAEGGVFLSF